MTDNINQIPFQPASIDIWDKKYRLKDKKGNIIDENIDDTYKRVARALADVETDESKRDEWYEAFLWVMRRGAIPAGRITSNAGALEHKPATSVINCTVSDTVEDSMDGIMRAVHEAALTLKAGCVSPDTYVYTEKGLVTAKQAVNEKHKFIMSYDRSKKDFEMRKIQKHLITQVPKSENIRIHSKGVSLTTSINHPVLVYRDGILSYVRAEDIRKTDALVRKQFSYLNTDLSSVEKAWFTGAHLGDGSSYKYKYEFSDKRKNYKAEAEKKHRVTFKIRAAEEDLVRRYAKFFEHSVGCTAKVVENKTPSGTPVWDFCVRSYEASKLTELFDNQIGKKTDTLFVPKWIYSNPQAYFLPFLAGLIDSDGCVSKEYGSASISAKNKDFVNEIKNLLGFFGIHASVTRQKPRSHTLDNGLEIVGAESYTLKICDSAFLKEVSNFMCDTHKKTNINKYASKSSGHYNKFVISEDLSDLLEEHSKNIPHLDKLSNRIYHRLHRSFSVSGNVIDKWDNYFSEIKEELSFTKQLREVTKVERYLDIDEEFYDFTVEGNNNYVAGVGGLLTIHNCGIGYEFSTLRPKNAYVAGAGSYTSGPLSFMDIFDKMCFTVASAGGRRGAQMATFDVSHPDVKDFISAKRTDGAFRQFNLSLLITDEFMKAVENDQAWPLVFPINKKEEDDLDFNNPEQVVWKDWPVKDKYIVNDEGLVACKVYSTIPARNLWNMIMASTYDYAEPGFILIDKVNDYNNNWWCENLRATNPCVTADTRLHTQYGLVRAGDLYASQKEIIATVDKRAMETGDEGVETKPAIPMFMTSPKEKIYKITTMSGHEIKATWWHELYSNRGKLKLKDLQIGDTLWLQSGKGQFGNQGSEDIGEILGFITGDGHITNNGKNPSAHMTFWGDERPLAEMMAEKVNKIIAGKSNNNRLYETSPVAIESRNLLDVQSQILARILNEEYGFNASNKHRVPEVIFQGSEECVKGYLKALFQCDGTVQRDDKRSYCTIRLASSETDLLKDVQLLLSNFGIVGKIYHRRKGGMRMMPDGKGGKKLYKCRDDYELIIGSKSRDLFMSEIGFFTDAKNNKYNEWREIFNPMNPKNHFTSKIKSIEYIGEEAVYDTTQKWNNNLIFNGIVSGNCGEQPLCPEGSCLLGSVNLTKFVKNPFTDEAYFDFDEYRKVVGVFTRLLDNVVEINGLPLEGQRREIEQKRRHGMGYLGIGSTLTMLKIAYGTKEAVEFTDKVTKELAVEGWRQALTLAKEKGPAPILAQEFEVTLEMLRKRPEMKRDGWKVGDKVKGSILHAKYSKYMQQIAEVEPELVKELAEVGARFTHHSSIAPTGTISLSLANNASNGIEPSFGHHYSRNIIREGRKTKEKVDVFSFELLAYRELINSRAMPYSQNEDEKLPDYFVVADDITPTQHVDMQAAAQKWIDSSISKTANVPTDYPFEDFKDIYLYAYRKGLKGCTTFRFNPEVFQGVLVKESDLENTTYQFTLEDGSVVEFKGNEMVEYDGEIHTAANLFDALKEGYYGKY